MKWNHIQNLLRCNIRGRVIIVAFLLAIAITIIQTSYALFEITQEKEGALNVIAANLFYTLSSPELNEEKKIIVPAQESVSLDFIITSQNAIDTNYVLYFLGPLSEQVQISYVVGTGEPAGEIGSTDSSRQITVVIENNSDQAYTTSFGVQGGLLKKEIKLSEEKIAITESFTLEKEYVYSGNYERFSVPVSGYYQLEAYGAMGGGNNTTAYGGLGAYTKGSIYLTKGTELFVYVGEAGKDGGIGGYNGGANTAVQAVNNYGGGGATDFRLVNGAWNDAASLRSRIMVAAGGGGSSSPEVSDGPYYGGNGGTVWGETGKRAVNNEMAIPGYGGGGGTDFGGLEGNLKSLNSNYIISFPGTFGIGGTSSHSVDYSTTYSGGGGGGGYYGGGGGIGWIANGGGPGGGGSSYISGYSGVNSIDINGIHTNNTIHYSSLYFLDGEMKAGINSQDGRAKITYLSQTLEKKTDVLNNVRYIKTCVQAESNLPDTGSGFEEIQAIQNGRNVAKGKNISYDFTSVYDDLMAATDGILNRYSAIWSNELEGTQCITVDLENSYDLDEIGFYGSFDGTTSKDIYPNYERMQYGQTIFVSSDNQTYRQISLNSGMLTAEGVHISAYQSQNNYIIDSLVTHYDMKYRSLFANELHKEKMYDISGNDNHATLYDFLYSNSSGWVEDGIKSSGTNKEYVRFRNPVDNKKEYTVELVARVDQNTGIYSDFITFDDGYVSGVSVGTTGNSLRLERSNDSSSLFWSYSNLLPSAINFSISFQKINTFTLTIRNGEYAAYLNGTLITSGTGNNISSVADYINLFTRIKDNPYRGSSAIGTIYSVRIYDKMLSKEEVVQNYQADQHRFGF